HYAAYGSNLDPARMRAYCPYSPMIGTGWLEGWRLTFAGEDLLGWEGEVTALVYVFASYEGGLPTAWYLAEIANAAEKAGAPDDYLADLRARPTKTAMP